MASAKPPVEPGLTGQVLFYNNPEPLDSVRHAKLGMKSSGRPYAFAALQHFIPLHVGEFGPASLNYPIIFAGVERSPLAVLGLREGENLFITPEGQYRVGAYIPSFIRRYPFVGARDDQAQRIVVCIDRSFGLWSEENPDVMLFENGEATDFTKRCVEFCGQFDKDRAITENFTKLLIELDLLESQQTRYTPRDEKGVEGEPVLIAEYFAVSVAKLNALPVEKLAELRDSGALQQIYAHLNSLLGWDRLVAETSARANAAPAAANA